MSSRAVNYSHRLYRSLLIIIPAAFRHAYGDDMTQLFRDTCRDAARHRGAWGVIIQWPPVLWDLIRTSIRQRLFEKETIMSETALFDRQLGNTVRAMTVLLRSGYNVLQTFTMIADESPEPTASALKDLIAEVEAGTPLVDALDHLRARIPSDQLAQVIDTMLNQRDTGGNLADILDPVAAAISKHSGDDEAARAMMQRLSDQHRDTLADPNPN